MGKYGKAFNKYDKVYDKDPDVSKGLFNVPNNVGNMPADGYGFKVGDGIAQGVKGIKRIGSKRTTFRKLGAKEGKSLSKYGKKSALRKLK